MRNTIDSFVLLELEALAKTAVLISCINDLSSTVKGLLVTNFIEFL